MVFDTPVRRHTSIGVIDAEEKNISSFPDGKADPPNVVSASPLALRRTTTSVAQEVTIKQVAPLVLVLTGATFLNVC